MLEGIFTSISLGLLATTNPCVLPLYPGFLAYISGGQEKLENSKGRYFLGFFVLAGVLTMMLALGALIASLSVSIGRVLSIVIPIADLIILTLGILMLANINPFKQLPQINVPFLKHPFANAYVYGLLYGPITLPCSGPLILGIFVYSFTAAEVLSKLSVFFWFGIGFGMPLLLLSLISGASQRWITRQFAMRARLVNTIGGLILVGVAIFDLIANRDLILAFFG